MHTQSALKCSMSHRYRHSTKPNLKNEKKNKHIVLISTIPSPFIIRIPLFFFFFSYGKRKDTHAHNTMHNITPYTQNIRCCLVFSSVNWMHIPFVLLESSIFIFVFFFFFLFLFCVLFREGLANIYVLRL